MNLDYAKIKEAAQNYQKDMTKFLREIVKNPGESCDEKAHITRIAEEMRKLDFTKVEIDPMGNVLGYMGTGKTLIAFDAHIDTVGIGNRNNWNFDPYEGYENETEIGGRGGGTGAVLWFRRCRCFSNRQRREGPLASDVATVLAAQLQRVDIRAPFGFQAQRHLKAGILQAGGQTVYRTAAPAV